MAASLIVLLPVILLFILNQKFITKGIMMSGLKE
jgi:ABC-type glycerol-3-phosphate transport system permease component